MLQKIVVIFFLFFVLQLSTGLLLIYGVTRQQTTDFLQHISQRIKEDISYNSGKWDIHRYIADPQLPGTYPVYVLSSDGFVLDRWKPVHGFLDTSDVQRLFSYQSVQTITTPTNQTWRILSHPIARNNQLLGVMTVAYFNPPEDATDIDKTLQDSMLTIQSKVHVQNDNIDATKLDVRDINYNVAFQVVDKFNRIIIKSNNTNSIDQIPNYTDTSYVGSVIQGTRVREIQDDVTQEKFLVTTTPLVDTTNNAIGVIVAGRSISSLNQIIQDFVIAQLFTSILFIIVFSLAAIMFVRRHIITIKNSSEDEKPDITHISFDKKTGALFLDDKEILIPYATNQYYLCEALFSNTQKKWEVDELLEKFGEQDLKNWRKVYDAMIILNKKVSNYMNEKLIVLQDKTYQINPKLITKVP